MKYLYKILRLFFCPHKYTILYKVSCFDGSDAIMPSYYKYHLRCRYCGKIKVKKT